MASELRDPPASDDALQRWHSTVVELVEDNPRLLVEEQEAA